MIYSRIHPTGTVRYNPDKCWNGLTLVPNMENHGLATGTILYDMNGNAVKNWPGLYGAFDAKLLPGGQVMGTTAFVGGYWLDARNLVQLDWEGNTIWSFDRSERIRDLVTGEEVWSARQHHDFQREGSPTGYYCPGQLPKTRGKSLLNSSATRMIPEISKEYSVCDTRIIEIDEEGQILWSWSLWDHIDELGLDPSAKQVIAQNSKPYGQSGQLKDVYCNCISYIGPNRHYDAGDQRFHPDNIITDIRALNVSFIIEKKTGKVIWRLGPDFVYSKELQDIGQIVGQHQFHVIPKGLPGEGNVMLFDNGGLAGMGAPTPCSPRGFNNATRGYSRVLEIDPITMKVVWSFNDICNFTNGVEAHAFCHLLYSEFCSSADRLPNGNTLITETIGGRAIEVTPEGEIVWEFLNPGRHMFRVHRYPYDWAPLAAKPKEEAVAPPLNAQMRITPAGGVELVPLDTTLYRAP
jgi:hypothetical protein